MSKTPLRSYLEKIGTTAEDWAVDHGFSPWSVRHWSRGNKVPDLNNQILISTATNGEVQPEHWLAWSLERRKPDAEVDVASEPDEEAA